MKKYWKKFLNLKIKEKILYSNIFIILFMVVILGVSIYYFSGQLAANSFKKYSGTLLEQYSMNLNNNISTLSEFVTAQQVNSPVSETLQYDPGHDNTRKAYNRKKLVEEFAYNIMNYFYDVEFVFIKDMNGATYYHSLHHDMILPSEEMIENCISKEMIEQSRGKLIWNRCNESFNLASKVIYSRVDMKKTGFLTLGVRTDFFEKIYGEHVIDDGSGLVIIDQENAILSSSDQESKQFTDTLLRSREMKEIADEEIYYHSQKHIYSIKKVEQNNLYIMNVLNSKKLNTNINAIFMPFFYAVIIAVIMSMLVSSVISHTISGNIKLLLRKINDFSRGDFSNRIEPQSFDEIGELAYEFNRMSDQIQQLLENIAEEKLKSKNVEIKALQSEYNSLQAKINPHFLYNTLESINSMAKIKGEHEISEAIQLLGKYLRDTINNKNRFVLLKDELENVISYMKIQKILHGERLEFEIEQDEILLDTIVPKLILQPIVENAIVHGIEPKTGREWIKISVQCQGPDLCIQVKDNGVGIEEEKLKNILIEEKENMEYSHVGILSVYKRIQILYGKQYGISIESKVQKGTTVSILLPMIFEGEENDVSCSYSR